MRDFTGKTIQTGDVLAYALCKGSSAALLVKRYVVAVEEDHIKTVPRPPDIAVTDRRSIGRIKNTHRTCLVIERGSFLCPEPSGAGRVAEGEG